MYHFPTFYESAQAFNLVYTIFLGLAFSVLMIQRGTGKGSYMVRWVIWKTYVACVTGVLASGALQLLYYVMKV